MRVKATKRRAMGGVGVFEDTAESTSRAAQAATTLMRAARLERGFRLITISTS